MNLQKPMLAAACTNTANLRYPVYVSPKLDGVRATVQNGVVLSRSLKPIPNLFVQKRLGVEKYEGLDGELIVGDPTSPTCYRDTVSGVMTVDGTPDCTFYVFDTLLEHSPFEQRMHSLRPLSYFGGDKFVRLLHHVFVGSQDQLLECEEEWLSRGYEGLMINSRSGLYKHGRSTEREGTLLKLKRFSDSEAEIVGFVERLHNANEAFTNELGRTARSSHQENKIPTGTLGALILRDLVTGVTFECGTGFDDDTRKSIWLGAGSLMGAIVKYKHFSVGGYDKPRFPTFLGFRPAEDL